MNEENISKEEDKVLEELKNAFDSIEAMKETDEHKIISMKIESEIAKDKKSEKDKKDDK